MQRSRTTVLVAVLATTSFVAASCGSDDDTTADTTADTASATAPAEETDTAETPPVSPASLTADAQESDGSTITVASIDLPAPGFIAVHADADGSPGAIIGSSEVLPAGESTDVVVTLDETLTESATLWPMAHIDMNDNGVYEFDGGDVTIDVPALTDDEQVAVVPVEVTVS